MINVRPKLYTSKEPTRCHSENISLGIVERNSLFHSSRSAPKRERMPILCVFVNFSNPFWKKKRLNVPLKNSKRIGIPKQFTWALLTGNRQLGREWAYPNVANWTSALLLSKMRHTINGNAYAPKTVAHACHPVSGNDTSWSGESPSRNWAECSDFSDIFRE